MNFVDARTMNDATNKAFLHFEAEIRAHFAAGGQYRDWIYEYGSHVGSGFQNIGTRRTPVVRAVPSTDKMVISFVPDSHVVSGFRLETSFPYYPYPPPP